MRLILNVDEYSCEFHFSWVSKAFGFDMVVFNEVGLSTVVFNTIGFNMVVFNAIGFRTVAIIIPYSKR